MKLLRKSIEPVLLYVTNLLTPSIVAAQVWTQTSAPGTNWTAIACSADGSKLIAAANGGVGPGPSYIVSPGPIFISTNSAATWIQATNAPDANWLSVASSADGYKLTAVAYGGRIYRSVDSGLTWTQTAAMSNKWVSIASSADGNKLAVVAGVFPPPDFYTSSDAGNTWITNASPYDRWIAIASSADGETLVACGPGTVLASTNSGSAWATNSFGSLSAVASSADGSRLLAAGSSVFLSTNSGLGWTQISSLPVRRIASSADGRRLVAAAYAKPIYVSTNFGTTWVTNTSPSANWSSVVCSADGAKLAAAVNGGGIWVSQSPPAPSLRIRPANGNLTLSWIKPSADFVLQQDPDLTAPNWTDVTSPPVLNLTNLQNEVNLPLTSNSDFFRLKAR